MSSKMTVDVEAATACSGGRRQAGGADGAGSATLLDNRGKGGEEKASANEEAAAGRSLGALGCGWERALC